MPRAEVVSSIQRVVEAEWGPLATNRAGATSWRPDDLAWFCEVTSGRGPARGRVGVHLGVYLPEAAGAILPTPPCPPGEAVPHLWCCSVTGPVSVAPSVDVDSFWLVPGRTKSAERARLLEFAKDGVRYFAETFGNRRAIVDQWERTGTLPENPPSRAAAVAAIVYSHLMEDDASKAALEKARQLARETDSLMQMHVVELVATAIAEGRV
jgi:hypothetical protein